MNTYKIVDKLDYVAFTLVHKKHSFIFEGNSITIAASKEFIENIKAEDPGMRAITFYEQK